MWIDVFSWFSNPVTDEDISFRFLVQSRMNNSTSLANRAVLCLLLLIYIISFASSLIRIENRVGLAKKACLMP